MACIPSESSIRAVRWIASTERLTGKLLPKLASRNLPPKPLPIHIRWDCQRANEEINHCNSIKYTLGSHFRIQTVRVSRRQEGEHCLREIDSHECLISVFLVAVMT
jgi:hypothetical protein